MADCLSVLGSRVSAESKDGTGGAEGSVQIKEAYGLGGGKGQ